MIAAGEVALPAKKCFIDHAISWVNPKTVSLALLNSCPPNIDIANLATEQIDTRELLWSNSPLVEFFNIISASSPCLTRGTYDDWRSFRNNNMPVERLIFRSNLVS